MLLLLLGGRLAAARALPGLVPDLLIENGTLCCWRCDDAAGGEKESGIVSRAIRGSTDSGDNDIDRREGQPKKNSTWKEQGRRQPGNEETSCCCAAGSSS